MKGVMNCRPRLDRVHEVDIGPRQELAYECHLGERGTIKMANAPGPKRPQHARLGIAFDSIQSIAREKIDKSPGSAGNRSWTQAQHRLGRPCSRDDYVHRWENSAP